MYVTRRKRVVKLPDGREIDFGAWKLTDFIMPDCFASRAVFAEAWGRLSRFFAENPSYASKLEKTIGLDAMVVKELWNVVNIKIAYRHDDPVFQTPDFWQLPNETWGMGKGDCEDTTFLLESAIRGFSKDAEAYAVLGFYVDPYSRKPYGHAWVLYKADFYPKWLWLETTWDTAISQSVWYVWDPDTLVPVYWFSEREAHRIDRDYEMLGLTEQYVEAWRELIDAMIDYVEAGRWLRIKWMHKGRRVPAALEKIVLPSKF